jgi:GNAT superfamily N-acetyltransferase
MSKKIGRNQPCICGSGIKSKKCIPTHPKEPHDFFDELCDDIVNELGMVNGKTFVLPPISLDVNRESKFRMMNSSEGWISMMSRYVGVDVNRFYIELNQMWIRKEHRGKGLGSKWIETINKISKKYDTEVLIQVSDLDYLEEIYNYQKSTSQLYNYPNGINQWNQQFGYSDEFLSNYVDNVFEWVETYEDITDDSKREILHNTNNERLKDYYTKFGYQPFEELNQTDISQKLGEYFMVYR